LVIAGKEYDLAALGRFIGCIHARMDSFHRDDAEFDLARMDAKRRPGHRSLLAVKPQNRLSPGKRWGSGKGPQ
jgi:hypothetical protein